MGRVTSPRNGHPTPILYVALAPFFSGAERALVGLLEHLDRTRFRPIVVVGTRGELEHELRARDVQTLHVPLVYASLRAAPAWVSSVARVAMSARRVGAALIHANDVPSFQPAGYAARLLGLPTLVHVRFPDSARGYAWFLRSGFTEAVFVSASQRDDALNEAPAIFRERSHVVYDGVRIPDDADLLERDALRRELQLPHDAPVVALVGQVAEVKGIHEFVDAAATLAAEDARTMFVVVGDDLKGQGALRRQAEATVAARGLSNRFRFLGFRRDARRLLPAFDVVAVPSHVEPLGLSALEGMAAAVPVVGSRVGGIQETVVDGVTGLLVPPRDADALSRGLRQLVADPERARALGRAGRARVTSDFSIAGHARQIEALYGGLLGVKAAVARQRLETPAPDGTEHMQAGS